MHYLQRVSHFGCRRLLLALTGLLLVAIPLASCGTPAALQFTTLDLGIPAAALQSPITKNMPADTKLHVGVTFKINDAVLNSMNGQRGQTGQPSHLEQGANRLGISDATYQKIKDFFNVQGIVLKLGKLHTNMTIDAKASTLGKLLQTSFVYHQYNGRTFFAPKTAAKVPQFLADSIVAVTGLDNYSLPPVHAQAGQFQPTTNVTRPQQDCSPDSRTLFPKEIAHAYSYDQLWNRGWHGENMTVNLVEIDGSYKSDIQNYQSCTSFQGRISAVDVDGSPSEAAGESTLDIEMVMGLARSSNIVVYQTDSNSGNDIWTQVNDELQQIINDNTNNGNAGSVVSISLGAGEDQVTSGAIRAIDQSLSVLTRAEHMTVYVASGDCGAFGDRAYRQLAISFPASDPWAVSVGGTVLSVDGNSNRANEPVWSDGSNPSSCKNAWGSGGGNSQLFRQPSWQSAPGVRNQYSRGMRQVPDVAAAAYALAVYFQGQWGAVGGTSAAAPIWAAGQILINEGLVRQGHAFTYSPQQYYYAANNTAGARPYYDVTRGNNLYYPATAGWDYATGLGTPNLNDLLRILLSVR